MGGVAAVVVTFNRKHLLARCLEAIRAQTSGCERVFIIDNASSDGTFEFLSREGLIDELIEYVRLPVNTGSAGGFHEGMKRAHAAGYEWLWLMDDDGCPASDCLEHLLSCHDSLDVIGPAVVRPDDPSRLTWGLRRVRPDGRFRTWRSITTYRDLVERSRNGVYVGIAALFNGVLVRRAVPEAIGFVLDDLFIWGDENEYLMRCKEAGFRVGICVGAFHHHAYVSSRRSSKLKFYYLVRNTMYIHWRYGRIQLPAAFRPLYPAYISLRLLLGLPSLSGPYLLTLIRGAQGALKGNLIAYERIGGETTGDPPGPGLAVASAFQPAEPG
jgi:rhamnopyranosyl-N-acetylglucosaminyl-diphospho-decaprenol beta-1,3/1,4-galactofuranosyltransferase